MQKYADIDRDSGVMGFEVAETSITIYFKKANRPMFIAMREQE